MTVNHCKRLEGGRRVDWSTVDRPAGKPLITIITSTFNAANDLQWTIDSIRAQTYPNIQWIIADGASTDNTLDVVRENEDVIDVWFSERDSGIYDAWNRALAYSKGSWVQFLGAGDELADDDCLARIAPSLAKAHPAHDLVYGRLQYISERKRQPLEEAGEPWDEMRGKWAMFRPKLPVHPETFHHASIMIGDEVFDPGFVIAGDSHFLMKQIKKKDLLYVPILVTRMPLGGMSGMIAAAPAASLENKRAARELGFVPPLSHQITESIKLAFKRLLLAYAPQKLLFCIADIYRLLSGKRKRWTL